MAIDFQRRLFTVKEYDRMGEVGILRPEDRVELLRGEIVKKLTIGDRHRGCLNRLHRMFVLRFDGRAYVQSQNPVVVLDDSEPEPDIALLHINDAATGARQVMPADVFALIEVTDASRDRDTKFKKELYAEGGIREYWVLDLIADLIYMNRDPKPATKRYRTTGVARRGETIAFDAFPNDVLAVDDILGPA